MDRTESLISVCRDHATRLDNERLPYSVVSRRKGFDWAAKDLSVARDRVRRALDAESLGKKLLSADPAILRVFVLDRAGRELAHVYSEAYPKEERLGRESEIRLESLDIAALEMFKQAEQDHGPLDFILLVFKDAKVMLMQSKAQGLYLAIRILPSANAESLRTRLEPILTA